MKFVSASVCILNIIILLSDERCSVLFVKLCPVKCVLQYQWAAIDLSRINRNFCCRVCNHAGRRRRLNGSDVVVGTSRNDSYFVRDLLIVV